MNTPSPEGLRERLAKILPCRCDEIWTCRNLHAPECLEELQVDVLDAIAQWLCSYGEWSASFDRNVIINAPHRRHVAAVVVAAALSVAKVRDERRHVASHRCQGACGGGPDLSCSRSNHHEVRSVLTTPWREVEP